MAQQLMALSMLQQMATLLISLGQQMVVQHQPTRNTLPTISKRMRRHINPSSSLCTAHLL
jgi:hypothetical protein